MPTTVDLLNKVRNTWCKFSVLNSRPLTQSGRPITGFVRPSTQSGRPGTMEQAIKTPRTASTARPVTSASGRFIRLGTVSKYVWNCVSLQQKTLYLKYRICPVYYLSNQMFKFHLKMISTVIIYCVSLIYVNSFPHFFTINIVRPISFIY